MTNLQDIKARHSDITRRLEADVTEEQRLRGELKEKQDKLQQQANSDAQMADGLIQPILKRRENDIRDKTKLEGQIELLEQMAKEQATGTPVSATAEPPRKNGAEGEAELRPKSPARQEA